MSVKNNTRLFNLLESQYVNRTNRLVLLSFRNKYYTKFLNHGQYIWVMSNGYPNLDSTMTELANVGCCLDGWMDSFVRSQSNLI